MRGDTVQSTGEWHPSEIKKSDGDKQKIGVTPSVAAPGDIHPSDATVDDWYNNSSAFAEIVISILYRRQQKIMSANTHSLQLDDMHIHETN